MYLEELSTKSSEEYLSWANSLNFHSHKSIFYEVMIAEDRLSDSLSALPESEQQRLIANGEFHTPIFNKYLEEGVIKYVTDSEGSTYWDYAFPSFGLAGIINKSGLANVEGAVVKLTSPIRPKASGINGELLESRSASNENWSDLRSWYSVASDKRIKVNLIGESTAYLTSDACSPDSWQGITCRYFLETHAQKKNFRGTWVYSGNYGPSFHIGSAGDQCVWSFEYKLNSTDNPDYCLNFGTTHYNDIIGSWPTSPYYDSWSWTNHGEFYLNPHTSGYWNAYVPYFFDHVIRASSSNLFAGYNGVIFDFNF